MRIEVYILMIGLLFTACHSNKKMANRAEFTSVEPVEVTVRETVRDTMVVEEEPQPARPETVVKTHGADLMHYCVIVGSFVNKQNAINLRSSLMRMGFLGTSIMQNDEGMYRVSAECSDSHEETWKEVCRIRSQYPQFRDAWLLEVKN